MKWFSGDKWKTIVRINDKYKNTTVSYNYFENDENNSEEP
jgi:hypothetical protein